MSLRVRLILAFVALSVVPLAAMTLYTYASNERALRDAAEHESDMLASELSQRMQLITTQLSERVDHLMDLDAETGSAGVRQASAAESRTSVATSSTQNGSGSPEPAVAAGTPAPAGNTASGGTAPPATATAANAATTGAMEAQVADRLGDAAMLLNNVEIRGLFPTDRGRFPRGGPERRGGPSDQSGRNGASRRSGGGPGQDAGRGQTPFTGPPRPAPVPSPVAPPLPPGAPQVSTTEGNGSTPTGAPARPVDPGAAPTTDRITIDLSTLRRDMFAEIAPGRSFEEMDSAERLRVIAEVNQRLLGIRQGLRLGAAELQKQAEEAKRAAESPSSASASAAPAVTKPVAATPATASQSSGPDKSAPSTSSPAASKKAEPMTKKGALTGTRLNVRREQNGVVRQVNAEVNLPDLLAMVFSATPRDRGEVPFALDKAGRIYAPTLKDRKTVEGLGGDVAKFDRSVGATQLPEWIVVTTADPSGSGLKFGIARPVGQALNEIRKTAARSAGLGFLFISATLILIVPLSGGLTRNLSRLSSGVHRIATGDYGARVPVTTKDEIGKLALAFNQMAADVEKHQRTAIGQERIKRELELGREIQHDMLPQEPLRIGQTEIRGVSTAAGEVGGDFFNYFPLKNGRIALLVGDVAGKGVGAALLMANLQASLRTRLALGQELTSLADELDRDVQASTPETVYSTLFVGTFDPVARILHFVNAGHNPQYLLRRRGGLERLESSGLPVGLLAGRGYMEGQTQLEAGDVIFCYTDGCVEAENPNGDMFGADALERELLAAGPLDAEPLLAHMDRVIGAFRNGRDLFDDATMMVVKVG